MSWDEWFKLFWYLLGAALALLIQWALIASAVRSGILRARHAMRAAREEAEAERLRLADAREAAKFRDAEAERERQRRAGWNAAHPVKRWVFFALKALFVLALAGGLVWVIVHGR